MFIVIRTMAYYYITLNINVRYLIVVWVKKNPDEITVDVCMYVNEQGLSLM